MKKLLLLAFCCYLSATVMAQITPQMLTVKGMAVDSVTKQPVSYVTVALEDAGTKAPIKSNLTKDDGSFALKAAAGKPYTLALVFVGYSTKEIIIPATGTDVNLGKILLRPSTKQLKDVAIVAARPLMKQEVDRISYDVAADPESKSLTALDMMRKVPLLTVDASDNIQLKGSGNYKILVNGKESALLAKNPSDVLRSMPATNIVRIEVITTPPAKYDAEGLVGIINIITVKNADQGYNIGINTRYNSLWGPGLNLNSTVKEGKFGFSGYAGFGKQNKTSNPFTNTQTFFANQSVLSQSGTTAYTGNYKYGDGEFSYEIDSLNLLTASVDFQSGANDQQSLGLTKTQDANYNITQQYLQNSFNNSNNKGVDAAINYQLGFKKSKDQLLTLSYRYNYSPNDQNNQSLFSDTIKYTQPNYRQYNNSGNREQTIQVDYAQPFKKFSLEAGGKAIFRNNFSNFSLDTLVTNSNEYQTNQQQTNDFNYHQNVYSLYNSYQLKLDKWTGKAGLRLEETTINADFSSVGSNLNTSYNNFIPSVSIQRQLKNSSINFGFTERIQRPDISQLNPFVDQSNPQFVNTGNPNLKPELNHVFELNYSRFSTGSINIGLSYSFSNNSIQNVSSLKQQKINDTVETVTYTTYENLGSNQTLGLNINTNYPITKQLSFSINGLLNRVWLKGFYNGGQYANSGFVGNMFTNISYKFNSGYRIGTNTGFFSGDVNLQGKSSYFIFNQFVFSKDLLKKAASVSFVMNNPYAKYWSGNSTTRTNDYYQVTDYSQTYRSFAIRLSYKFGKLNSDIKKNQHGIENDDTKGGTKNNGNQ
jgi:Outer membrane protein beta-barrel family/CarboxypepD_reg-like domain